MSQKQLNFLASIYNELMLIQIDKNILSLENILNNLQNFIIYNQQILIGQRKENENA